MSYTNFSQHRYKVTRLSDAGHEVSSTEVVGSRAAFALQQDLEVQGLKVSVFNMTRGVQEYPLDEDGD